MLHFGLLFVALVGIGLLLGWQLGAHHKRQVQAAADALLRKATPASVFITGISEHVTHPHKCSKCGTTRHKQVYHMSDGTHRCSVGCAERG